MSADVEHIREHLAYSTKIDGLEKGHLQEMQQLLDDREQLRDELFILLDELTATRAQLANAEKRNEQLQSQLEKERARPIQAGMYIERQTVDKQIVKLPKRSAARKITVSPNQLQLWNTTNAASM